MTVELSPLPRSERPSEGSLRSEHSSGKREAKWGNSVKTSHCHLLPQGLKEKYMYVCFRLQIEANDRWLKQWSCLLDCQGQYRLYRKSIHTSQSVKLVNVRRQQGTDSLQFSILIHLYLDVCRQGTRYWGTTICPLVLYLTTGEGQKKAGLPFDC